MSENTRICLTGSWCLSRKQLTHVGERGLPLGFFEVFIELLVGQLVGFHPGAALCLQIHAWNRENCSLWFLLHFDTQLSQSYVGKCGDYLSKCMIEQFERCIFEQLLTQFTTWRQINSSVPIWVLNVQQFANVPREELKSSGKAIWGQMLN